MDRSSQMPFRFVRIRPVCLAVCAMVLWLPMATAQTLDPGQLFSDKFESSFFSDAIGRETRSRALRWATEADDVGAKASAKKEENPVPSNRKSRRSSLLQVMVDRHQATSIAAAETGVPAEELHTSAHLDDFMHEHDHALISMLQVSSGLQDMGRAGADAKGGAELRASQYFELIEDPLMNLLVPIIIKIVISLAKQPILLVLCQLLAILLANLLATPMAEAIFPGLGLEMPGAGASPALLSSMSPLARQAMTAFSKMVTTTSGSSTSTSTSRVPAMLLQTDESFSIGSRLYYEGEWTATGAGSNSTPLSAWDIGSHLPGVSDADIAELRNSFVRDAATVVQRRARTQYDSSLKLTESKPAGMQAEVGADGSVRVLSTKKDFRAIRNPGIRVLGQAAGPAGLLQTGGREGALSAAEGGASSTYGACGARHSRQACVEQPLPDGTVCSWCEAVVAGTPAAESEAPVASSRIGRCVMCRGSWGSSDHDLDSRNARWAAADKNDPKAPAPVLLQQQGLDGSLLGHNLSSASFNQDASVHASTLQHDRRLLTELGYLPAFERGGRAQIARFRDASGLSGHVAPYMLMQGSGGPAIPAEDAALSTAKGLEALKSPDGSGKQLWQCSPKPTGDDACSLSDRPNPPEPRPALDTEAAELAKSMGSTTDPGQKVPPGFIRSNEYGPVDADPPPAPFFAEPIVATNSITERVSAAAIEAGAGQIVGAVLGSTSAKFGRALRSRLSRRLLESVTPTLVQGVLQGVAPAVTKAVRERFAKQTATRLTRTAVVAAAPAIAAALTSALGRSPAQDYFCALCEDQGVKVAEFASSADVDPREQEDAGSSKDKPDNPPYLDPGQLDGAYCRMCQVAQQQTAAAARTAWSSAYRSAQALAETYAARSSRSAPGRQIYASSRSFGGPSGPNAHPDLGGSDAADNVFPDGGKFDGGQGSDHLTATLRAAMTESQGVGRSPAQAARDAARAAIAAMARDRGIAALEKAGIGEGKSASREGAKDGGVATAIARGEQMRTPVDEAFGSVKDELLAQETEGDEAADLPVVGPESK